jgi:hypothetical protein
MVGIKGKILHGKSQHAFEKLVTGHTSEDIAQSVYIKQDDYTAHIMLFIAQKP